MLYRYPDNPVRQFVDSPFFQALMKNEPEKWVGQRKRNGWRRPGYKDAGSWTFHAKARTGDEARSPLPPELAAAIASLDIPDGTAFDMEWVGKRDTQFTGGRHWFEVFDILYYKHQWQGNVLLRERMELLRDIFSKIKSDKVVLTPIIPGKDILAKYAQLKWDWEHRLEKPNAEGVTCEGLVVKDVYSTLKGSFKGCADNGLWMKIKYREI